MADPNTRQGKRTPVTLKIKFKSETLEQFIERYAVDVSQGGIFIRTKEPLAVGTQMRFEFQLRDASPLIAGEGTVVWTRENDPSRPAIAPGMGVRFDRLAEGSQTVLERILSEKAKQAPQRAANESTKPPLFTDTPTKVAPLPIQEALTGDRRRAGESFNDQHTPLPKPMPFHSDAEDFDEQAFEEATKVRALDELIAQTADGDTGTAVIPPDELAARRLAAARADSTVADAPVTAGPPAGSGPIGVAKAKAAPVAEEARDSAPGLPSPPSPGSAPRMLDAPGGRVEVPPADAAKTKLGFEAPRAAAASTPPRNRITTPPKEAPAVKEPSGAEAVATGVDTPSGPAKRPVAPSQKSSAVPVLILILVLVAAAGGGVWFFYLRPKAQEAANDDKGKPPGPGTAVAVQPTADATPALTPTVDAAPEAPKGPIVDTTIAASTSKATVEIVGTDQKGNVPFTAKLEKDKAYRARISAPGFATLEVDVKGGQDKITAKLDLKPRVVSVATDPPGALIFVDNAATGHTTPHEVVLTKAQAAKARVKITMRKGGYKPLDKILTADAFQESDARMEASLDEKLVVHVRRPPPPPPDRGTTAPDAGAGTGATTPPADSGTGTTGTGTGTGGTSTGTGAGTASPPPPAPTPTPTPTPPSTTTPPPPAGAGTAAAKPPEPKPAAPKEPEPGFVKP